MSDGRGWSEGEVMNGRDGTQDEMSDGVTSVANNSDELRDVVTDGVTSGVTDVVTDGGQAGAPKGAGKYLV